VIGLYSINRPSITGESWFLSGNQRQQTLRQEYVFTTTAAIAHGITNVTPGIFTHNSGGTYTDGTSSFGLPFCTSVAVAGVISFYVTTTQIVFVVGAGAPVITSGRINLEWLASP